MENNVHIRTNGANRKTLNRVVTGALGIAAIVGIGYASAVLIKEKRIGDRVASISSAIKDGDLEKANELLTRYGQGEKKLPAVMLSSLQGEYGTALAAHVEATRRDCLYDSGFAGDGVKVTFIPDAIKYQSRGVAIGGDLLIYEFNRMRSGKEETFANLRVRDGENHIIFTTDERQCTLKEVKAFQGITSFSFTAQDADVMSKATQRYREITRGLYDHQHRREEEQAKAKQELAKKLFEEKRELGKTLFEPVLGKN